MPSLPTAFKISGSVGTYTTPTWYIWYKLGTNTFGNEERPINASAYFKTIYPYMNEQRNQGVFVTNCFAAAGSHYFPVEDTRGLSSNMVESQRMIYKGERSITSDMKRSFPAPFKLDEVSAFYVQYLKEHELRTIMSKFAIPPLIESNIDALARALATQFQLIILSASEDVSDIVAMEYQRLLYNQPAELSHLQVPFYCGDSAYVVEFKPRRQYYKKCYDEKFEHTWLIRNSGSVTWQNRRLVYVRAAKEGPLPERDTIDIPETAPNAEVKLTMHFDTFGIEGSFDSKWEMRDSEDNNCFPNDKRLFTLIINVIFN